MLATASTIERAECPYEEWTDEELFFAYRYQDDNDAFNDLVRRYERELYSYLRRYVGDAGLAEDTFQETFINVVRGKDKFEEARKFRPWLYTIATHLAIDCQRRNKRHTKMSLDTRRSSPADADDGALKNLLIGKEQDGYDTLENNDQKAWINAQIATLSDQVREAVQLVYFQGLKYREAADILQIPIGTVKSRLHTAILELRAIWEKQHVRDVA